MFDCISKILYFYILWQVLGIVIQQISSISYGLRVDCSNISMVQDESIVDLLLSYHAATCIAHYFILQNIITNYHKYLIKHFSPLWITSILFLVVCAMLKYCGFNHHLWYTRISTKSGLMDFPPSFHCTKFILFFFQSKNIDSYFCYYGKK